MAIPLTNIKAGNVQIPDAAGTIKVHNMVAYWAEVYYAHYKFKDTSTLEFPNLPWALKGFQQGRDGKPDLTSYTLYFPRTNTFESEAGASWLNVDDPSPSLELLIPSFQIIKA